MELQKILADNVRGIREQKKLTLDAAARLTGVSRSMLAQIEKGEVNPTISVLWKIAGGYKVSFTSLVNSGRRDALVIRASEVTPLAEGDGRYLNYPAFPFQQDKGFETYRIRIAPGGALEAQPHLAGTEEYITVFAGSVEIRAGERCYRLNAGDSLRFRADVDHAYRNAGDDEVQLSMLIYYEKG